MRSARTTVQVPRSFPTIITKYGRQAARAKPTFFALFVDKWGELLHRRTGTSLKIFLPF